MVEGDKMSKEILNLPDIEVEGIYALESWIKTNEQALTSYQGRLFNISVTELGQISSLITPNQVLVVIKQPLVSPDYNLLQKDLSLFLDGIQDPGNMGTILRVADWFGITQVFCSPDCVEIYNPKVIQATMGAFLRVGTSVISLPELRKKLPDITFYGATMSGESIFKYPLNPHAMIIIGNEGQGISSENLAIVDQQISIPGTQNTGMESLNAGVATGIICAIFRNS